MPAAAYTPSKEMLDLGVERMYAGKVEICGVDTARLPVLSEAEKSRLIKAARAGDRQARQEMVACFQPVQD